MSRRRTLLTGLGIALASAMLTAAVVLSYGLGTGFDRAARAAGLPDVIVRFAPEPPATILRRLRALPDVARLAFRYEVTNAEFGFRGHFARSGVAEVVAGHGHGYAVLAGHGRGVMVERGLADAWGIGLGDRLSIEGLGTPRVTGIVEGPDDVGYPLAAPRIYISVPRLRRVNYAQIWLRDPAYTDEVLTQARATSYGLRDLQFATRGGVRILLDQAAGIVIDLLVALSLIALVTAGVLLTASARAEVQRRLGAIGIRRAVGETRAHVSLALFGEGLAVSAPATAAGLLAGLLLTYAPSARLLTLLNEPPPGWSLWLPLGAAALAGCLLPAAGAAWPAWRAAGRSIVALLRGADVSAGRGRGRLPAGLAGLGARLAGARRVRLAATMLTLGLSCAFVLLMLALAAELSTLETDPGALGKRYQLSAALPPTAAARVRRIPGVAAVAPRYETGAADSFALGESIDVVAYPGDHTRFEAPALVSGRRLRGPREAEVGVGLANALGLSPGSVLALALGPGVELRLRVSGVVSSLTHEGRVAYLPARALLRADPGAPETLAVRLAPGADQAAVSAALARLGGAPAVAAAATARGAPLVAVLRTILRAVAVVDGLVCLYALVQACSLTVLERRRTVAVLRAVGGGAGAVRWLLAGAASALVIPAAAIGVALERWVFGPALSRLAVNYATLDLAANASTVLAVVAGLAVAGAVAVLWVARAALREPVVQGLSA